MLLAALIVSAATTLGVVILVSRIGMERLFKLDWSIDVLVSVAVLLVFQGTATGVMTAALTGGMLSAALWIMRRYYEWKKKGGNFDGIGEGFKKTFEE